MRFGNWGRDRDRIDSGWIDELGGRASRGFGEIMGRDVGVQDRQHVM